MLLNTNYQKIILIFLLLNLTYEIMIDFYLKKGC